MSTKPKSADPIDRARQYIDDVIRINSEHGMRSDTSEDAYRAAVTSAAESYQWTHGIGRKLPTG